MFQLKMITSIFDPLGYFAPSVLEAKLFMKAFKMPPWGSPAFTFSYHNINHKAVTSEVRRHLTIIRTYTWGYAWGNIICHCIRILAKKE